MALTKVKAGNIILTTPAASSNDVTPATTAYVTTALANLADSAPSTLNTLNELAAALGDDANFSTTVTNSIAGKLPLAGGTMTGALNMGTQNITNAGTISSGDITVIDSVSNNFNGKILIGGAGSNRRLILEQADVLTYRIGGTGSNSITQLMSGGSAGVGTVGLTLDASQNATFAGTISSGAITSTGSSTFTGTSTMDINLVAKPPELNFEDTSSTSGTKRARWTLDGNLFSAHGLSDDDNSVTQDLLHFSLSSAAATFGGDSLTFSAKTTHSSLGNILISIPDRAASLYNVGDRGNITIQASSSTSGAQALSGGRVLINAGNSNNGQSGDVIISSGANILNSTDNGKIRFNIGGRTSSQEAMRIHSSGAVTKPKNCYFLARRTSDLTYNFGATSGATTTIFTNIVSAQSSALGTSSFSTVDGTFTAPVDGLYLFHWSFYSNITIEQAWITSNGARVSYTDVTSNSLGTASGTVFNGSMQYYMLANASIRIHPYSSGNTSDIIYDNIYHTYWKGVLLG